MPNQKSLKKNAILNFLKSFANIIFPIISFPYASRILLPDGIGAVNFANSIIEYFIMAAELGIGTYAAREAAKIRDDKYELTKFTREILSINFYTTIFAYLLLIISLFSVDKFSNMKILLIICSTKILFSTIGINWFYTAIENYAYITLRHLAFQAISLILLFTLVKTKSDYAIYAAIGVFSNVGANIINIIYSRKFVNIFEKTPIELKKHFKPILTFFGVNCAGKVNGLLDTTMLGFLNGNIGVGLYIAATKLNKMVRELISSVLFVFMPRTSYLLEKNKTDEYKTLIKKVFNVTFFFSFPATVGLYVLSEPLTILFCGDQYVDSIPIMKLLCFLIIILSFNSFINNLILTPNSLEKFMLYAQIASLTTNLILNYFFIKKWGVFGAGLATLIVETVIPMVKLIPAWKYIKNKDNFINILKSLIGSACIYFLIILTFNHINNNLIKIILSTISGAVIYAIIEIILRHPTANLIVNMLKKRLKRK